MKKGWELFIVFNQSMWGIFLLTPCKSFTTQTFSAFATCLQSFHTNYNHRILMLIIVLSNMIIFSFQSLVDGHLEMKVSVEQYHLKKKDFNICSCFQDQDLLPATSRSGRCLPALWSFSGMNLRSKMELSPDIRYFSAFLQDIRGFRKIKCH